MTSEKMCAKSGLKWRMMGSKCGKLGKRLMINGNTTLRMPNIRFLKKIYLTKNWFYAIYTQDSTQTSPLASIICWNLHFASTQRLEIFVFHLTQLMFRISNWAKCQLSLKSLMNLEHCRSPTKKLMKKMTSPKFPVWNPTLLCLENIFDKV